MSIWHDEDLSDLDAKFDALAEFLEVEFVFERISDGSDIADRSRCFARRKSSTANQWPEEVLKEEPEKDAPIAKEQEPEPAYEAVENHEVPAECSRSYCRESPNESGMCDRHERISKKKKY